MGTSPSEVCSMRSFTKKVLVLAGAVLLAGCSRSLLTAPAASTSNSTAVERDVAQVPPPANLLGGVVGGVNQLLNWVLVTSTLVPKDQAAVVSGGRWSLAFAKGS